MISETAQEQAALFALGLLDADEAAAFERELADSGELRALVKELGEAAAQMARTASGEPAPGLKDRVLSRLTAAAGEPAPGKVVPGPWTTWLPWALAATLALCCGALEWSRETWRQKYDVLDQRVAESRAVGQPDRATAAVPPDALREVVFCTLDPAPQHAPPPPRVAVLWDAPRRQGKLRLEQLPPPAEGHDYQLWVVETGRKDAVSAGVVKMTAGQNIESSFEPVPEGGKEPVVAFALSLERAGGAPRNQGPILFLGKL